MSEFNFPAFKIKALNAPECPVFVGDAAEIRAFVAEYEETKKALEESVKELAIANGMIKGLKEDLRKK